MGEARWDWGGRCFRGVTLPLSIGFLSGSFPSPAADRSCTEGGRPCGGARQAPCNRPSACRARRPPLPQLHRYRACSSQGASRGGARDRKGQRRRGLDLRELVGGEAYWERSSEAGPAKGGARGTLLSYDGPARTGRSEGCWGVAYKRRGQSSQAMWGGALKLGCYKGQACRGRNQGLWAGPVAGGAKALGPVGRSLQDAKRD